MPDEPASFESSALLALDIIVAALLAIHPNPEELRRSIITQLNSQVRTLPLETGGIVSVYCERLLKNLPAGSPAVG